MPKLEEQSDFEYTEVKETFSTWKNNSPHTARFTLVTDDKRPGRTNGKTGPLGERATNDEISNCKVTTFVKYEIAPGQTKQIASKYDQAIRWVSPKTGEAVQGLCPWLTKVGEEEIVVHSSLDYKQAIQTQQALDLINVLSQEQKLREALAQIEKTKANITIKDKK